ncbi:hypothetical protein [Lachnospira multipara]|jgi:predicted  nucleic acid-binding Zn-ribbon protein|uniref:hypothetical protein n=1 Tax=Lachnospira multipara TaxID=28051 RepID=UPI0004E265A3|nr:hypothetical protein [Lachnospira multipara]
MNESPIRKRLGQRLEYLGFDLEKYENGNKYIQIKCKKCGEIYDDEVNVVINRGRVCSNCGSSKKKSEMTDEWDKNIYFNVIKNTKGKVKIKKMLNNGLFKAQCTNCNKIWDSSVREIKEFTVCPNCAV